MADSGNSEKGVLILVSGMKGAIATTAAAAIEAARERPEQVWPYLMTADMDLPVNRRFQAAGWDIRTGSMTDALIGHGVLEESTFAPYAEAFATYPVRPAPDPRAGLKAQIRQVVEDMADFKKMYPDMVPVLVNLLPACQMHNLNGYTSVEALCGMSEGIDFPDLVYALAAIESKIPVINFTPNEIEVPAVINEAVRQGVPMAGRDGKTGQTYWKVVMASAFAARKLYVNGWYSLNILGNADGENLMDPAHAACKLTNKTDVLDHVLGYRPGEKKFGKPSHKVHIDYYPPRGDAKEAWDVIDFESIFSMPMSIRLNLQGRDSILAAPMVLDLARWMAALSLSGRSGPIGELAFFFKKSIGEDPPRTFQDQLKSLEQLADVCRRTTVMHN